MRVAAQWSALALVLMLGAIRATPAQAADATPSPDEEYEKKIHAGQETSPLSSDFTGENVSLYDGSTTFTVTDVDLPGNNTLPVRIGRRFKVEDRHNEGYLTGFSDWDLDLPRIQGVFLADRGWKLQGAAPYARCSSTELPDVATSGVIVGPRDVWQGTYLYVPGQGDQELLINDQPKLPTITDGQTYPWVTTSFARVRCLPQTATGYPGEAFVALTADGTQYTFDYVVSRPTQSVKLSPTTGTISIGLARTRVSFLPTRVDDRFGNSVIYSYAGDKLTGITASDGRAITLTWNGEQIQTVTANGRTWTYGYTPVTGYAYAATLNQVTQPDGSKWTYSATGTLKPLRDAPPDGGQNTSCPYESDPRYDADGYHLTIGHPSGASVNFDFGYARTYRTHTPVKPCSLPGQQTPLPYASHYYDGYQLVYRTISGPGIAPQQWTYIRDPVSSQLMATGSVTDPCPSCQQTKTVTVTEPDGAYKRYEFGIMYGLNEGKLLQVEQGEGVAAPLSTTTTQLVSTDEVAIQRFPDVVGTSRNLVYSFSNRLRPVKHNAITQDGVTFNSTVLAPNGVYDFDAFGRTLSQTKSSALGSKVDATTYWDNRSKWVLGQIATSTTNGIQVSRTDYDPTTALALKTYQFGKPQQTLTYNLITGNDQAGTIATVKDGNNHVTTLSSWKCGIPQTIKHPATPEAPTGAIESASVDDNGWIRAVTDANGYSSSYDYDLMGRIKTITYPTGDAVPWNNTTLAFDQVAGTEYGIGAGHWRQTISTGNARKISYFDALLRPVVTREYDATNVAGTQRFIRRAYDLGGHEEFTSYPGTTDALTTGIHKTYDALDRVKQIDQDSELGALTTITKYLSGFRTEVTNPRLFKTTTSYRAYDQPTTDLPVAIIHPEGVYTDIARNSLDKPTSITRRNGDGSSAVTRSYAYNGYQELCKTTEPETRATLMGYDAGGNLSWSAAGLPIGTLCDLDGDTTAIQARKTTRGYDARNRVTTLSFADGKSDTSYTYTPDGKLATITALNAGSNIVTTTYGYNKRRLLTGERMQWGSVDWTLGYNYDINGNLAGHVYPSGLSVDYLPNALGQPTRAGAYATGVSYYPNGGMQQFTYGNGIVHTLTQNARQLPDVSRDAYGTTEFLDDGYDYDANGNVAAISDGAGSARGDRTMVYDGLDRLTDTTSPMYGTAGAHYTYDELDNLTSVIAPGRTHTYIYDTANRLTNVMSGSTSVIGLHYDVQGNLDSKNSVLYGFDMGNRLRSVSGSPASSYVYDGHGRRVQDQTSAAKQSFYSFGGQLMYTDDQRTSVRSNYIYLNGSLVARDANASALGTPVLTVPSSNTSGSYTVQWSSLSLTNRYQLQEQFNGGSWAQVYDGTGTSLARTGKPLGTFGYRVRGCIDTVCGGWSGIANVVESAPTPPPSSAPVLTAPATGLNGSYTISWTAVSGAASYTLEQSVNVGAWTSAYSGSALSQPFSGKAAGSYAYRIKACNTAGCSAVSAAKTVQVIYPPTAAPTLSAPATSYTGSYAVPWTAVSGATSYTLEESINAAPWASVYTGIALTRSFSSAGAGSHGYRVKVCNAAGCGPVSATDTVQVTYPPASTSAVTAPATNATGSYSVTWTAVGGATSYQLDENLNSGAWAQIQNSSARSKAIAGKDDGSYGYRVKACNVAGCGPVSVVDTTVVTIPPPVSPTINPLPVGDAGYPYTISWTSSATATSYELQESANGGAWVLVSTGPGTTASRTQGVGTYSYRVRACSAKGCSAYSATKTTTVERNGCPTCLMAPPPQETSSITKGDGGAA